MGKLNRIALLCAVITSLFSCDKIDNGGGGDDPTIKSTLSLTSQSGSEIKGFAADGASCLKLVVKFGNVEKPESITIKPSGDSYGFWSGDSVLDAGDLSAITLDVTAEDITAGHKDIYLFSDENLPADLVNGAVAIMGYSAEIDSQLHSEQLDFNVEVIRSGVVLAHGFGSDPTTFNPMLGYITPMNLYLPNGIYALDYASTSLDAYVVNKMVIPNAIDTINKNLLEDGYVSTKVSVAGHSMGGILTRLYLQSSWDDVPYRGDILKIINIDSPHSGTQLADFGVDFAAANPDSPLAIVGRMGAVVDFQTDSPATLNTLNGESLNREVVPTHIFTGTFGDTKSITELIKNKEYVEALLVFLVQDIVTTNIYEEENDLVVPLSSQEGGIKSGLKSNYIKNYSGVWHCTVQGSEEIANDIVDVLNTISTDDKLFTMDGYNPPLLSYKGLPANSIQTVKVAESELRSMDLDTILSIGLDAEDNIVDMGYSSDGVVTELNSDNIAELQILGFNKSNPTKQFYSKTIK